MKPRALTPEQAKHTLAHRLAPRVDRLRQFATRFGVRAYRCFLVWDRYAGGSYGVGERQEVARHELLPTPRVRSLDSLSFNPFNAGMAPTGNVRLDLVSATYTFDELRGLMIPERHEDHLPSPYEFYYELVEDGRGDPKPVRHKFRLMGVPGRREGQVGWAISLERISGDNDRDGESTYGT